MVTLRLKDHFGIHSQRSSTQSSHRSRAQRSLKTYKSVSGKSIKGTTQYQPIIVETSSEKEDDASTITMHSKPTTRIAKAHGHMTALNTGDVILLGGPKEVSTGLQNLPLVHSSLMWMIHLLRSHTILSWIISNHPFLERLLT